MTRSSLFFLFVQQAPPSLEHDGFIELEQEAQVWEGIVQDAVDGILELYAVVLGHATENEGVVKSAVEAPSVRLPYYLFAGMVVIGERLVPFGLRSKRQLGIKTRFIEEHLDEAEEVRFTVLHLVRNDGGNILGLSEAKDVEKIDGCLHTRIQVRPPSVIMGVADHFRIRFGYCV